MQDYWSRGWQSVKVSADAFLHQLHWQGVSIQTEHAVGT